MKPKQYIQGYTEFYKLRFKITPDVLIPRPETELLVDEVLSYIKRISDTPIHRHTDTLTIFDLGTGSGNIAISIAKNLTLHLRGVNVNIIATDISPKALKVAKQNSKLHGVEDKITFIQSNLLNAFCHSDPELDSGEEYKLYPSPAKPDQDDNMIIVTNLPYIPTQRIPYLDSSVKDFEPHIALDGGEDGFELYRKLFQQILNRVCKVKLIVAEIDYTHGELAVSEALKYFPGSEVKVKTDLAKKQRILIIKTS